MNRSFAARILALLMVPVFFVVVQRLFARRRTIEDEPGSATLPISPLSQ